MRTSPGGIFVGDSTTRRATTTMGMKPWAAHHFLLCFVLLVLGFCWERNGTHFYVVSSTKCRHHVRRFIFFYARTGRKRFWYGTYSRTTWFHRTNLWLWDIEDISQLTSWHQVSLFFDTRWAAGRTDRQTSTELLSHRSCCASVRPSFDRSLLY